MTNREFYKEEIIDIALSGYGIAVDKRTLKPVSCDDLACGNCINSGTCVNSTIIEWANAEYIEPCELEKDEFKKDELVEVSQDGIEWVLGYFAYDACGLYFTYANGWKSEDCVSAVGYKYCRKYGTLGGLVKE